MTDAHWLLARLNKRKTHDALLSDGNSGDMQLHRGRLRGTQSEGPKGLVFLSLTLRKR